VCAELSNRRRMEINKTKNVYFSCSAQVERKTDGNRKCPLSIKVLPHTGLKLHCTITHWLKHSHTAVFSGYGLVQIFVLTVV
jgi:hypothetical protein